jgi:CubicO group peptidase (beta-lactamase class C family)
MSSERLAKIDEAVLESIARKETPGAVVLVARKGSIVYRKAFGDRALEPKREAMTVGTIFDLASLTKIIATATSIMILVERGKVSLADPVARYIPEFAKNGKERVLSTVDDPQQDWCRTTRSPTMLETVICR